MKKKLGKSKRITIMIDDELDKKIRLKQAKHIEQTTSSMSFSRMINQELRRGLK